jgi:hypothetical protein
VFDVYFVANSTNTVAITVFSMLAAVGADANRAKRADREALKRDLRSSADRL